MTRTRAKFGLPVLVALLAAAVLLGAGVAMARYEDRLYSNQQQKDVSEQAQILAASAAAAVVFDDHKAAQEYIDALKVNTEIQAAAIYDDAGKRMAGFLRQGVDLPGAKPTAVTGFEGDHLNVVVPVLQDSSHVGTVFLRATAEPAQRRLARYAGLVLLVTMGALVIAVLSLSQAALQRRADELSGVNRRLQAEMAERRKTEEVLRQSQKMEAIGQLSGGISHDFNNLIMIVKGNLRLLRKRLGADAGNAEQYISSADDALMRAANLTQRILAFSRRQPLTPKSVRLSELVTGMGDLLRHSVGENVEIDMDLRARWWTQLDVNQMENVILNLAINARDAMPDGGKLTISTRDEKLQAPPAGVTEFVPGDYVALTLADTGSGMSKEVRERAVDPFFTTKPLGKGTGLGLSMAFGYVRQSGGYLAIESESGKGTAITLLMLRDKEEAA